MKKVLYVSGTRADYGPFRSTLKAIDSSPLLELSILVTGMHLLPKYGLTVHEIERDGFAVAAQVPMAVEGSTGTAMAMSMGLGMIGMAQAIERISPDQVIVLGDRTEMLAAAIVASHLNIPVVHVCGGSLSGSIDEQIRHSITKFANFHLPALEKHANRIVQLGEDPERIRVVGLPGGDLKKDVVFSRAEVLSPFGLQDAPVVLFVVQHSVTWQADDAGQQMRVTLDAVVKSGFPCLVGCPNNDAGSDDIHQVIKEYTERYTNLYYFEPPASRQYFVSVLAAVQVLLGNSSMGMGEALSLSLPVVNIGVRQRGREEDACILNAPHEKSAILQAISTALTDSDWLAEMRRFQGSLVRDNTESLIVDFLEKQVDSRGLFKTFFDGGLQNGYSWEEGNT